MSALFVALNADTWVNVNDIKAIQQSWTSPEECTVTVGKVKYAVRCSAREFLNRIESVRT